jgi:hypothetical protein
LDKGLFNYGIGIAYKTYKDEWNGLALFK